MSNTLSSSLELLHVTQGGDQEGHMGLPAGPQAGRLVTGAGGNGQVGGQPESVRFLYLR